MCLAQGPQGCDAGDARTSGPSVSSQAPLSLCAPIIEFIKQVEEKHKMPGLTNILSIFCNKFDKFNNAGARMLDSIYHMAFEIYTWHCNGSQIIIVPKSANH